MKNGDVRPISRSVTETIQDRFIVLMKDKNPYTRSIEWSHFQ